MLACSSTRACYSGNDSGPADAAPFGEASDAGCEITMPTAAKRGGTVKGGVELREWAIAAESEDVVLSWMTRVAPSTDVDAAKADIVAREADPLLQKARA